MIDFTPTAIHSAKLYAVETQQPMKRLAILRVGTGAHLLSQTRPRSQGLTYSLAIVVLSCDRACAPFHRRRRPVDIEETFAVP